MSARYEISEGELDVLAITGPEGTRYIDGEEIEARVIRQQSADIAELSAVVALLTHKVICCGVAASHPNAALTTTGAYADKWDSPQAESVRKLRAERDQLRAELAAAVAERDRIKGDYGEAAHFARHFIRDDPNITPRGAIIRFGDKCTDLFVRLQQAEARLSAIDSAPVVAVVREMKRDFASGPYKFIYYDSDKLPAGGTELIAKP